MRYLIIVLFAVALSTPVYAKGQGHLFCNKNIYCAQQK